MKDNTMTESITFRTTTEMKKKIETLATKEARTTSNMIEVLLDKALEKVKK